MNMQICLTTDVLEPEVVKTITMEVWLTAEEVIQ